MYQSTNRGDLYAMTTSFLSRLHGVEKKLRKVREVGGVKEVIKVKRVREVHFE